MKDSVKDGKIVVYASKSLVSKSSILKTLYWFGENFHTQIIDIEKSHKIILTPFEKIYSHEELNDFLFKLQRDLIDFELRTIVRKETKIIHELLVAKAFSNYSTSEDPPGEISDPVGFNIDE